MAAFIWTETAHKKLPSIASKKHFFFSQIFEVSKEATKPGPYKL